MKRTVTGTLLVLTLLVSARAYAATDPEVECRSAKKESSARYMDCLLKAQASFVKYADSARYEGDVAECNTKFTEAWSEAEAAAIDADSECDDPNEVPDTSKALLTDCMECVSRQLTSGGGDCFCSLGSCPSGGVSVGARCWYSNVSSVSCDALCASVSLTYDEATLTYAGSDGSFANCNAVLSALGAAATSAGDAAGCSAGLGCMYDSNGPGRTRCTSPATTSSASAANTMRACACQ